MDLVATALPFDTSWWGRATVTKQSYKVHYSHLINLPQDVPELANQTDPGNIVALRSSSKPEVAHVFAKHELFAMSTTAALSDHMHVTQVMCIAKVDCTTGLVGFVSVARHAGEREFCESERQFLELLMPHLTAALDLCCMTQISRYRQENYGNKIAMIATDARGFVHANDNSAGDLLQCEWPEWTGACLPTQLVQHIANRRLSFTGNRIHAKIFWSGEHAWLALQPREPTDLLTPQEFAVASAFSSGQSYKEVARDLLMAPATVRHHLRSVYLKLGISDKAALANQIAAGSFS